MLTSIAPAPKKRRCAAIGRSRGGLTTKIHALVDALGNPIEVMLSPGQDHDLTCTESLIDAVDPGALIADKAFDADPFIGALDARAITPWTGHFLNKSGCLRIAACALAKVGVEGSNPFARSKILLEKTAGRYLL